MTILERSTRPIVAASTEFFGREQIVERVLDYALDSPVQSCLIIGEPGSGKSTLIGYLIKCLGTPSQRRSRAKNEDLRCIRIETLRVPTRPELFWKHVLVTSEAILKPDDASNDEKEEDPFFSLHHVLEEFLPSQTDFEIRDDGAKTHRRIVIFIDDIDEFAKYARLVDLDHLRTLSAMENVAVIATGADDPAQIVYDRIEKNDLEASNRAAPFTHFDTIDLGMLNDSDAEKYVLRQLNGEASDKQRSEVSDLIVRAVGGHPALLRFATQTVKDELGKSRGSIDKEWLRFAIIADPNVQRICQHLYFRRLPNEQKELCQLASRRMQKTNDNVSPLFLRLANRGILKRQNHQFDLFSDVFAHWIRQNCKKNHGETHQESTTPLADRSMLADSGVSFKYSADRSEVRIDGETRGLSPLENRLLSHLFHNADEVCEDAGIMLAVLGYRRYAA